MRRTRSAMVVDDVGHDRGQAMLEYLWLCAVLLLALVVPWSGGKSPAEALLDAIVRRIDVFIWWLAVL